MFHTPILRADYTSEQLHGGTLGDVRLLCGTAETAAGVCGSAAAEPPLPYKLVWKTQKKWERGGDPGSWRREYDLYMSELGSGFTAAFRWPQCYLAEINSAEDEIQLWMEYIDGPSGGALTVGMLEQAAYELGRFQGRLYARRPPFLAELGNLNATAYMKNVYRHYSSWSVLRDFIRSDGCGTPGHLCGMLINLDEHADEILSRVEKLPVVFCHKDYWVTNIFCTGDGIVAIDWDTSGFGYLGEDIASLVADGADTAHMAQLYNRCFPAYYKGFSEYSDVSRITDRCSREMILLKFGYRLVEGYINAGDESEKTLQIETLQKIYEMGEGR